MSATAYLVPQPKPSHEKMFKVWRVTRAPDLMIVAKELVTMGADRLQMEQYIEKNEARELFDPRRPGHMVVLQMECPGTPDIGSESLAELMAYYNAATAALSTAQSRVDQLGRALKQKGIL